jgi:hypothetical protein
MVAFEKIDQNEVVVPNQSMLINRDGAKSGAGFPSLLIFLLGDIIGDDSRLLGLVKGIPS